MCVIIYYLEMCQLLIELVCTLVEMHRHFDRERVPGAG